MRINPDTAKIRDNKKIRHLFLYYPPFFLAKSKYSSYLDYQKFYLYSIITHSTAIEGSTVTEFENQLLFDEGITAKGKPMVEQLMNLDLKKT